MKMMESMKFVKVLRSVGSPTIVLGEDGQRSYESIEKYWRMLDALNYDAMFAESRQPNAKRILEEWRCEDWQHHGLTIRSLFDVAKEIWFGSSGTKTRPVGSMGISETFGKFAKKHGAKMYENGKWTLDEWRSFRWVCDDTLYLWQKRLNQLRKAYNYTPLRLEMPTDQQERPQYIVEMLAADGKNYADEFFGADGNEKMKASEWGRRAAQFVRMGRLKLYDGDKAKLWQQIETEFPRLQTLKTGYDVFLKNLK